MTPGLRYLSCLRLSADSDGSTSIEWQRGVIRHHVSSPLLSGVLVGEAEDTDVSGSMSPFKRPKLGKWLTSKADDFDVLIAAKMDRLTRRSMHFNELLEWAQQNGKFIVCVEEGFDLSTPQGKMMARMTAVFAEAEWDTIQARILNGVQSRLENRSWLTGAPPTGYTIKAVEGGKRKVLEIDQDFRPIVQEIFRRIGEGQSTHRIARDFNGRGVLTWGDHLRKLKGQETKGTQWQSTIINKFIRSSWVPGIYTYKGEAVLDDQGEPVILPVKPLASMQQWEYLVDQIKPAPKAEGTESRTGAKSLLAGIARCGHCDAPFSSLLNSGHKRKDGTRIPGHRYYRCSNKFKGGSCESGPYVRADVLDTWVDQAIQGTIGQWDMYERAGTGPSQARELQSARTRLEKLEAEYIAGDYDGEGQEVSYRRIHKGLSAKVALLEKQEAERMTPALWATGKKYGEVWGAKDQEDRREFLRAYRVKVWAWNDAIPNAGLGIVMDLGDIQAMSQELKLNKEEGMDRLLTGHNVPAHWISPELREFGTDDVPAILKELEVA
ncbi:recombinase family protein [Streptomyces sp. J2-1]|uniref:recombinase family protein n=1 Tax=Streptomyces corallincola TaxID=2851888 RepID=UPI001C389873|nr:recombinase family protein [Streptomyces corallincola]MBV2354672.1 recombinase family protein [Streptomyces corallincola]